MKVESAADAAFEFAQKYASRAGRRPGSERHRRGGPGCGGGRWFMPQTEEAISHANAAGVAIVVVLNKIDKPNANVHRCKDLLAKLGLNPVEWGGKSEFVEVSALTSQGIDNLREVVSLESQILGLKADPSRPAIGTVLDAESTTGRGIIATALIQDGTPRTGDYVLCGSAHGRVPGMWLNGTQPITEAPTSTPVRAERQKITWRTSSK